MFGNGSFGTNNTAFGFNTTPNAGTGLFGQTAATQPQQQNTSLFGGTSGIFGGTAQQTTPTFTGFGGTPTQSPTLFGQQPASQPTTTGLFGSTTTNAVSPFGAQQATQSAGTSVRFAPLTGQESVLKNGVTTTVNTRHQAITGMKEYENKSFEELRLEDYQLNRKGPQTQTQSTGIFGALGLPNTSVQPQTNIFSSNTGATTGATTAFGQFGQNTTTATTVAPVLFGAQAKPGGLFGTTTAAPATTGFGLGGATTGFQFNQTSQPQQQQSIFGANNTATSTPAPFSFMPQQQQQQPPLNLWGQKPTFAPTTTAAPAFTTGMFGSTAATTAAAANKPLFGTGTGTSLFGSGTGATTASQQQVTFGGTSIFSNNANAASQQQQQQAKPFSFSSFTPTATATTTTTQSPFGGFSSGFGANPLISTAPATTAAPTTNLFGASTSFGATTTGTTAPAAFTFSTANQTVGGTTTPSFGFGTNAPNSGNVSLFNTSANAAPPTSNLGGFGFGMQQQQPSQQQQCQFFPQQQQYSPGFCSFATTSCKDNPIFYNFISESKLKDMTLPTSPLAIRQYMDDHHKSRHSPARSAINLNSSLTNSTAWKRLNNVAPPRRNGSVSICKFAIFDGFDDGEEESVYGVNILAPKKAKNWKRLILNSAPTTPVSATNADGNKPSPGKSSPFSKSLSLSGSPGSRWLKSGELVKQKTRLNLDTLGTEVESSRDEEGGDEAKSGMLGRGSLSKLEQDLNRSLSEMEARIKSSSPPIRIHQIVDEPLKKTALVGAGDGPEVLKGKEERSEKSLSVSAEVRKEGTNKSTSTPSTPRKCCRVVCSRPGYYVFPSVEELDKMVDSCGNCYVKGFEVGRHNFGKIKFSLPVNVVGVNVDEIVFFRHKEVVVYPDDEKKPPLYEGLNVPAEIELERVWPVDKATNGPIRCLKKIAELNYEEKLRKACARLEAEFISYDDQDCVWRFRVAHFSKYSCDLEEENGEDEQEQDKMAEKLVSQHSTSSATPKARQLFQVPSKGLGGIPLSQQQKQMAAIARNIVGPGGDAGSAPVSTTPEVAHSSFLDGGSEKSSLLKSVISVNGFGGESESLFSQHFLPTPPKKSKGHSKSALTSFSALTHQKPLACSTKIWSDLEMELEPSVPHLQRLEGKLIRDIHMDEEQEDQLESSSMFQKVPPPHTQQIIMHVVKPVEFLSVKEPTALQDVFGRLRNINTVKHRSCPRVCFLPSGQFLSITQTTGSSGFSAQVKVSQFSSYADKQESAILSGPSRAMLQKQLENRLKMRHGVLFKEHIKSIQAQLALSAFPQIRAELEHEQALWQLCEILWPEQDSLLVGTKVDDGILLTQRFNIGQWLRENARILFGSGYNSEDRSVLGLLKKGVVEEACKEAINQGNLILATLLASDPHLLLQVEDYHQIFEEGMMEPTTSDIFALVSGSLVGLSELTPANVGRMSTHEWFQYFALYLWYNGPAKSSIAIPLDKGIREYEEMMKNIIKMTDGMEDEDEEAIPFPSRETSSMANLCMHLLKMYSCTGYPMHLILNPRTWTIDCLDYKLVWLLMLDLKEIGYEADEQTHSALCLSFAGQLEAIGLWKWAAFVLRNIDVRPEDNDKEEQVKAFERQTDSFVRRLLERNISDVDKEAERFLVHRLGVEKKLIFSIKSWKSGIAHERIWYLGKMGEWQQSFKALINSLLDGNDGLALIAETSAATLLARNVMEHLDACKSVGDWDVHGGMLYNYLQFKWAQVPNSGENGGEEDEKLTEAVSNFLQSVIKFQPSTPSQSPLLLEMAIRAQKVIQFLFISSKLGNAGKGKLYESLQQFLTIPVPNEYFEGCRSFINRHLTCLNDIFMGEL